MGFFKRTEAEKAEVAKYRALKQARHAIYMGQTLDKIGDIPMNSMCGLSFDIVAEVLKIHHNGLEETIPYDKIRGFQVEESKEVSGQWIATLTYAGKKRMVRERKFLECTRKGIYESAKKSNMAIAFETVVKGLMEA